MTNQITSKTYTLDFTAFECFATDMPDSVTVVISREDVLSWQRLAAFIQAEELLSIEKIDDRCKFNFDGVELDDLPHSVDFQPEYMFIRLQIMGDEICFVGAMKHSDAETWETSFLSLAGLVADFGLGENAVTPAHPDTEGSEVGNDAIEGIIEKASHIDDKNSEAFNDALLQVQQLLGVTSGDLAGVMFSGSDDGWRDASPAQRLTELQAYVAAEKAGL